MKWSQMSVLYVEDEPLIALDVAMSLESFGFQKVVVLHSLAAALRHVACENFELAVLDINLGGGQTSLDLGRSLTLDGTKVLFASGNSARQSELISLGYGYITKPFGPEALRRAINEVVMSPAGE